MNYTMVMVAHRRDFRCQPAHTSNDSPVPKSNIDGGMDTGATSVVLAALKVRLVMYSDPNAISV